MTLVMVVDDDQDLAEMLGIVLTGAGIDVDLVSRGDEVLDVFRNNPPDLVLLDVIMPNLGGIEVVKEIGRQYKVIIVSAVGQEKVVKEAESYGAVGYVIKPFDNNQVLEQVNKAIG